MAFFDNVHFPFFTMQELNLDWILKELKRIAGFMPQGGNVGDLLTRKSDGAAWEPPEAVNININALPEDTEIGDNDQLIFYDISAQANRKIKPPNLLDSMMSNGTPLMDGTASAGTSKKPARYDHKHPTDTSRQAALSGSQMNAVNSGAPASSFNSGILKTNNGGTGVSDPKAVEFAIGDGAAGVSHFGHGIYDPVSRTVRIYLDARSTSDIGVNTVLGTIPAQYRPASTVTSATSVCILANSAVGCYYAEIGSTGEIKQKFATTVREVMITGEYVI